MAAVETRTNQNEKNSHRSLAIALAVTTSLCPFASHANPVGGTITAGNAAISSSGNTLTVQQSSSRALIDWSSFNIASGETTNFQQPSSSSVTVNRIESGGASQINGNLNANGNIVIINPNGVMFGNSAIVNVNSITATSSNINDSQFMAGGPIQFTQPGSLSAQIINNGNITVADAGLVGLVAPHVENNGTITAKLGKVTLASGDTFTLDLAGDTLTQIAISSSAAQQLVANNGTIKANGGVITLTAATARNAVDALVTNTGTLQANTFAEHNGKIVLSVSDGTNMTGIASNSGTIVATGRHSHQHGGSVTVSAATVTNAGTIDVSGDFGGFVNINFANSFSDTSTSSIYAKGITGAGGSITLTGNPFSTLLASGTYNVDGFSGGNINFSAGSITLSNAILSAQGTGSTGGTITLDAPTITQSGVLTVNGVTGGSINITADTIDQSGTISALGLGGLGGNVTVNFSESFTGEVGSFITTASAAGQGGNITFQGGENASLTASGSYISDGSTTGGSMDFLAGQDVLLLGAFLSSQGGTGGGTILIGGNFQGLGTQRRSKYTYIDGNTKITVNATNDGDGGQVAVWSDVYTQFYGTISAEGGINGGNGGYVETSGGSLAPDGLVITNAPHGIGGQWLLDPSDLYIVNSSTSSTTTSSGTNPITWATTSSSNEDNLYATTIVNELNAGTSVIVQTSSLGSGGSGNIYVNTAISGVTGSGSLTLSAYANIIVNSNITLGSGNLTLQARNSNAATGYVQVYGNLTTSGGNVTIGGGSGTITAGSGYAIGGSTSTTNVGVLVDGNINAAGGNIIINGQGGTYSGGSNYGIWLEGNLSTSGTGTITLNGIGGTGGYSNYGILTGVPQTSSYGGTYYTYANITSTGTGAITLNGTATGSNYAEFLTGYVGYNNSTAYSGAIVIDASGGNGLFMDGTTIRTQNNAINLSGTSIIYGGYGSSNIIETTNNALNITATSLYGYYDNLDFIDSGAAITLSANSLYASATDTNAAVTFTGTGTNSYVSLGGISTTNGTVSVTSTGALSVGNIYTSNASITLTNTGGNVSSGTLSTTQSGSSSPVTITATGNISTGYIYGSSVLIDARSANATSGYVSVYGNLTTSGGNVTIGGGSGTISAGSGYAIGSNINGSQYGVSVNGYISAGGGNIIINGQGGTYSGGSNYGVYLTGGNISTTGTGTVNIHGIGGTGGNNNYGIFNGTLYNSYGGSYNYYTNFNSTASGAITLSGAGGSGSSNYGIEDLAGGPAPVIGGSSYTGNITIAANALDAANLPTIQTTGSGTITLLNTTPSNGISVGTNVAGTLNITNAEASGMSYGSSGALIFGDTASTGNITIGTTDTFSKPVQFLTGAGNITVASALNTTSSNGSLTFSSSGNIIDNAGITTSGGNVLMQARNNNASTGYVQINNANISTGGGNVTIGGGSGTITAGSGYAIGSSTSTTNVGVLVDGNINAAGGNIIINGQGGTYSGGSNYGIWLEGNNLSTSGTGTITLNGIGGTGGSNNYGIFNGTFHASSYGGYYAFTNITSTGSGAISLTGTGGSGSNNYGLYIGGNVGFANSGSPIYTGSISVDAGGAGFYDPYGTLQTSGNTISFAGTTSITNYLNVVDSNAAINITTSGNLDTYGSISTTNAPITLTSTSGNISVSSLSTTTSGSSSAVTLTAAGNINAGYINGSSILIDARSGNAATGYVSITSANTGGGNITIGGGSGTISAGSGFAISSGGDGVYLGGANAGGGNIIINGQGSYGAYLSSSIITTGTGTISIDGQGTSYDLYLGDATIGGPSDTGSINLTASNTGLYGYFSTLETTAALNLSNVSDIMGYTSIITANNPITYSSSGSIGLYNLTTTNSAISITSTGGTVSVNGNISDTTSGSSGPITLTAATDIFTGSITGSSVLLDARSANAAAGRITVGNITTGGGNITIGGGSGTISAGNGYAIGESTANAQVGVTIYGSLNANGGNIIINGEGGGYSGGSNYGVYFNTYNGGSVTTSGTGTISIKGIGGTGGNNNYGILNGSVTTSSYGGSYYYYNNITSTGSGAISLTGVGGSGSNNYGMSLGVAGMNYSWDTLNIGGSSYSGNLKLAASSFNFGSVPTIQTTGSGTITLLNTTASNGISVGTNVAGTLNITDTEIGYMNYGSSGALIFGDTAATGNITYNDSTRTFTKPVEFLTGAGNITVASALNTSGSNGSLTLSSSGNIIDNAGITTSGGNVLMQARNNNASTGYVQINNANISTGGGNVTIGGGSGTISAGSGYAIGSSTSTTNVGVLVDGNINAGGGNIIINGQGGTYSGGSNYGIWLEGNLSTSGTGTITLNGIGGTGGSNNYGIFNGTFHASSYGGYYAFNNITSNGSGAISLNGTSSTGSNNYGVYVGGNIGYNGTTTYTGALSFNAGGLGLYANSPIMETSGNTISFAGTSAIGGYGGDVIDSNEALNISIPGAIYLNEVKTTNAPISITSTGSSVYVWGTGISTNTSGSSTPVTITAATTITTSNVSGSSILLDSGSANGTNGMIYASGLTTGGGNITIGGGSGTISAGNGYAQGGVELSGNTNANGGNIVVNGQVSSGEGIYIISGQTTSTGSGSIILNGLASSGYGIELGEFATVGGNGYSGAITLNANSSGLNGSWYSYVETTNNAINLSGVTDITGETSFSTTNNPITYSSSGSILANNFSTTNAAISLSSTGASGGINLQSISDTTNGSSSPVTLTSTGNIFTGSISGSSVLLDARSSNATTGYISVGAVTTGGGNITIGGGSGTISAGNGYAVGLGVGVSINGTMNASGGNIVINGQGGSSSGGSNYGVDFNTGGGGSITTSGTGTINIHGIGGTGGSNNYGIFNGHLVYSSYGGSYKYYDHVTSNGSGSITLSGAGGTGSNNYGIVLGATGVSGVTLGGSGYSGNLTLAANSLDFTASPVIETSGSGTITLLNTTPSNGISVGTNVANTLNVSDTNIGYMSYGSSGALVFGDTASTGNITIGTARTYTNPVGFLTGAGNITVASALASSGSNGSFTFSSSGNIIDNASITTSGGNVLMQARNNNASTGYVDINSANISTSGGNITIGGGNGTITAGSGYAVGNSTSGTQYGVLVNGNINAGSGNILINGQGGAYSGGGNYGILLEGNLSTSGTGTISLNGIGGTGGNGNYGIFNGVQHYSSYSGDYYNTYSNITSTGSGAISLNGTGGTGSGNYGIYMGGYVGDNGGGTYTGSVSINAGSTGFYGDYTNISTNGGTISFPSTYAIYGAPALNDTNTAITLNLTGPISLGGVTDSGAPISVTSGGNLNVQYAENTGADMSFTSTGGNLTSDDIYNNTTGNVTLSSAGTTTLFYGVSTTGGNISITANSGLTLGSQYLSSGPEIATTNGTVSLSSSAGNMTLYGPVSTTGGAVTISSSGTTSIGDVTTSSAPISITGNSGISLSQYYATVSDTNGAITETSSGGGITMYDVSTTNANISATGSGTVSNYGELHVTNGSLALTSTGGNVSGGYESASGPVTLSAAGNITVTNDIYGSNILLDARNNNAATGYVDITGYGALEATGNITIGGGSGTISAGNGYAIGGNTNGTQTGVLIDGTLSTSSSSGNIIINGQGGAYSGGGNDGVLIDGSIQAYASSGTININIHGIGGTAGNNNYGLFNTAPQTSYSGGTYYAYGNIIGNTAGAISLTGVGGTGTGNYGLDLSSATVGGSSFKGNINLVTNALNLSSETVQTSGNISILNSTGANGISVGTNVAGTLNVSDAAIGDMTWGSSGNLIFGDNNTGNITINSALSYTNPLEFITGTSGNITLSHNISDSASGNAIVLASGDSFINSSSDTVTTANGRWIIYSNTYAGNDQPGGLTPQQTIFSNTFGSLAPSAITASTYSSTENTWVYDAVQGTITITANNASRYYGAANPSFTYTFSCTTGCTQSQASSSGSPSLTTSATTASNVGTYNIVPALGSLDLNNGYSAFNIVYTNGTLTVNPAALSITASSQNQTYGFGGTSASLGTTGFTTSGLVNGNSVSGVTLSTNDTTSASGNYIVGTYNLTPSAATGSGLSNYTITYNTANGGLTVNPALLTIKANNTSMTYGGTNPTNGYSITSGSLVTGDTISGVSYSTNATTTGSGNYNAGTWATTPSNAMGSGLSNYTITYSNGTFTVNPALLAVTGNNANMTYGSTNPTFGYTVTSGSLVSGDSISNVTLGTNATTTGAGNYNVGTWNVTPSNATGTNLSNYTISYSNGTLTVNPALLTITGNNANMTYGGTNPTFGYTVTNGSLVSGDSISGVTLATNATTTGAGNYNAGTWNVAPSNATGTNLSNYTISYSNGTFTVNPALLTITGNNASMTYGGTNPTFGYTVTSGSLVSGDSISSVTLGTNATTSTGGYYNAGTWRVTPSNATGTDLNNYTISYANGMFTVTPALLTVTANNTTTTYGQTPAFGYSVTSGSLLSGDSITGMTYNTNATTSGAGGANAGTWSVTPSNAMGSGVSNYTITYSNGTFIVNPALLTVSANPENKIYDNTLSTDPALTYTYSGLVNGDTTNAFSGALTRAPGEAVGSYTISEGTLASANSNYTIGTFNSSNFVIAADAQLYQYINGTLIVPQLMTSPIEFNVASIPSDISSSAVPSLLVPYYTIEPIEFTTQSSTGISSGVLNPNTNENTKIVYLPMSFYCANTKNLYSLGCQ